MNDDDAEFCDCGDPRCPECGGDCWYCRGQGAGIVGHDWPGRPFWDQPGSIQKCPNCGGSGLAKDCTFW